MWGCGRATRASGVLDDHRSPRVRVAERFRTKPRSTSSAMRRSMVKKATSRTRGLRPVARAVTLGSVRIGEIWVMSSRERTRRPLKSSRCPRGFPSLRSNPALRKDLAHRVAPAGRRGERGRDPDGRGARPHWHWRRGAPARPAPRGYAMRSALGGDPKSLPASGLGLGTAPSAAVPIDAPWPFPDPGSAATLPGPTRGRSSIG